MGDVRWEKAVRQEVAAVRRGWWTTGSWRAEGGGRAVDDGRVVGSERAAASALAASASGEVTVEACSEDGRGGRRRWSRVVAEGEEDGGGG
jgi:hypothetical protein